MHTLHVNVQLFQHHLLQRQSLLYYFCSFVKVQFAIFLWTYFWACHSVLSISWTILSLLSQLLSSYLHLLFVCLFLKGFLFRSCCRGNQLLPCQSLQIRWRSGRKKKRLQVCSDGSLLEWERCRGLTRRKASYVID